MQAATARSPSQTFVKWYFLQLTTVYDRLLKTDVMGTLLEHLSHFLTQLSTF